MTSTDPEKADMSNLTGRVALVTGASSGLGRAIAIALARSGANLVLAARSEGALAETAGQVTALGCDVLSIVTDVTSEADIQHLRKEAFASFGEVHIVVNNAGNLLYKPLVPLPSSDARSRGFDHEVTTTEEWQSIFRTHVDGAFCVVREFVPPRLEAGYGRIVNITSNVIGRAFPFTVAYGAAKAALAQMTRSLAAEWGRYGVTVNAVAPGHFPSAMTASQFANPETLAWLERRVPMRRTGEPDELAALVVFLATDAASYITGEVITVDGGETI
jgi:NAD(P)-dependent dehydrogenase (short-subunit alcohol dehydrogenase family)